MRKIGLFKRPLHPSKQGAIIELREQLKKGLI